MYKYVIIYYRIGVCNRVTGFKGMFLQYYNIQLYFFNIKYINYIATFACSNAKKRRTR